MAKESSKTRAIIDYCKKNPEAKPKAISEALKKELGLDVNPQYISSIRTKFGLSGRRRRRGRPRAVAAPEAPTRAVARKTAVAYENLMEAKKFVQSVGDIKLARQALDAYVNLQ